MLEKVKKGATELIPEFKTIWYMSIVQKLLKLPTLQRCAGFWGHLV